MPVSTPEPAKTPTLLSVVPSRYPNHVQFWVCFVILIMVVAAARISMSKYIIIGDVNIRNDVQTYANNAWVSNADENFFSFPNFFGIIPTKRDDPGTDPEDDFKPDFISTFDLVRLLDETYAIQQFHCVINDGVCDSLGLRLKGRCSTVACSLH